MAKFTVLELLEPLMQLGQLGQVAQVALQVNDILLMCLDPTCNRVGTSRKGGVGDDEEPIWSVVPQLLVNRASYLRIMPTPRCIEYASLHNA